MAKALIIILITVVIIAVVLCYFFIYPKYKEREIQADFKVITQQKLEDLKSEAFTFRKKCERKESSFFGQPETYYGSRTDHFDEYSDNLWIGKPLV